MTDQGAAHQKATDSTPADQAVADSYGAMDLSAMAGGSHPADAGQTAPAEAGYPGVSMPPAGTTALVSAPLIVNVDEANFEEVMALSQTVPVVLLVYSAKSLISQQTVEVLEDAARKFAGAFQLGKIDADTQAALVQALQLQTVPAALALVARRPVPLFEGPASAEQFSALMSELLQVAPQLGATGRIAVDAEALEKPLPQAHEAPRAAEMADDWEQAIALWKKVLANNPADKEAKMALARAEFEARQVEGAEESADALAQADTLFSHGHEVEAFTLLLDAISAASDPEEKEAARARLVELLNLGSNPEAVKRARSRLATMLLV